MKSLIKNNWMSLVTIGAALVWGISQLEILPEQMGMHFNDLGQPDQIRSKYFGVFFIPALNFLLLIGISSLLKRSPREFSASNSQYSISMLNLILTAFLTTIYFGLIKEALEPGQWIMRVVPFGLSVMTVLLGNYLGKLEKNFFIGLRLPWTLASEDNWKQTHRFTGKVLVALGLISLLISFYTPSILLSAGALVLGCIIGSIYSYRFFAKRESA